MWRCVVGPSSPPPPPPPPPQAFSVAERELSIAPVLKPSEMANADQLGLLAYLTQFYDVLHDQEVVGKAPEKKAMQKTSASKSDSQLLVKGATNNSGVVALRAPKESKVSGDKGECAVGWGGVCLGEVACLSQPASARFSMVSSDVCFFCDKRVYLMERQSAEGVFFHRSCFRCLPAAHCMLHLVGMASRRLTVCWPLKQWL